MSDGVKPNRVFIRSYASQINYYMKRITGNENRLNQVESS